MKNIILNSFIVFIAFTANSYANTIFLNTDDIDSINSIKIEELRDGFKAINGINVNSSNVEIDLENDNRISFKNGSFLSIQSKGPNTVSSGGDMGGGGK